MVIAILEGKFTTRLCMPCAGKRGKHFWHHKDCAYTRASVVYDKHW